MKYFCLFICLSFWNCVKAQSVDDSVRSAVNQLFTAMKNADSALLVSTFSDSAILQTIVANVGVPSFQIIDSWYAAAVWSPDQRHSLRSKPSK